MKHTTINLSYNHGFAVSQAVPVLLRDALRLVDEIDTDFGDSLLFDCDELRLLMCHGKVEEAGESVSWLYNNLMENQADNDEFEEVFPPLHSLRCRLLLCAALTADKGFDQALVDTQNRWGWR